jgi:hypothetical protein
MRISLSELVGANLLMHVLSFVFAAITI